MSNSAPPENSFQLAGTSGAFKPSTLVETVPSVYDAPEFSRMRALNAVTDLPVTVWEKGENGAGGPEFPPGSTLQFGSDALGTPSSMAMTTYYWGYRSVIIGVGEAPYLGGHGSFFRVGAKLTSEQPALTINGVSFGPNVMFLHTPGVVAESGFLGGGNGVQFYESTNAPPEGPSSGNGLITWIDLPSKLPYGWRSGQASPTALFAQPALITFGAESIGTDTTPKYLYPGYSNDAAGTLAMAIPMLAVTGRVVGISVWQVPDNDSNGNPIVYQVQVNGANLPGAFVSIPANASSAQAFFLDDNFVVTPTQRISVVATKAADVGDSPLRIVCSVSILPAQPVY